MIVLVGYPQIHQPGLMSQETLMNIETVPSWSRNYTLLLNAQFVVLFGIWLAMFTFMPLLETKLQVWYRWLGYIFTHRYPQWKYIVYYKCHESHVYYIHIIIKPRTLIKRHLYLKPTTWASTTKMGIQTIITAIPTFVNPGIPWTMSMQDYKTLVNLFETITPRPVMT